MKFIDLFSGIGGFRTGMEMNGHECVAFCEIDKYARQSYKAIYDTEGEEELHDITKWTDEHVRQFIRDRGHIDVITGGFPCQSFSIAGKRGGFDDTRGTLFFEIMRIANIIRPQYLFLENVKGLLNHDGGATFETILNTLDEFGYDAEWQVLNSKNFGVPQNRERVFIIGHLRGAGGRTVFPVGGDDEKTTKLQGQSLSINTLTARYEGVGSGSYVIESEQHAQKGLKIKEATKKGYAVAEPGDSVNISFPDSETRRGRVGKQTANTLLTGEEQAVVLGGDNDDKNKERNTFEVLSILREKIGEKKVAEWRFRILDTFQEKEILRQDVHEEILGFKQDSKEFERKEQSEQCKVESRVIDKQKELRDMSIGRKLGCTSQGQESLQQFVGEFAIIMQRLPHTNAQGEIMQYLRQTTQGIGILQQTLHQIQEIWESIEDEKQSFRIRKLTPKETWRLQGFTDDQFYKAKNDGVSDSQLYKQAGNSVTVNVIDAIAKRL